MSSNEQPCPIWDEPPYVRSIHEQGQICSTHRTGGPFLLMRSGAALLQDLTERQKVNLSYWIYHRNLQWRMINTFSKFEEKPNWAADLLELDQAWVEGHRDWEPSPEYRMLNFLRELIRSANAGEPRPDKDLLQAAGGCRHDRDLKELLLYALDEGWLEGGGTPGTPSFPHLGLINLDFAARIHVDEQLRERSDNQQPVVPEPAKNESEYTFPNIQNLPISEQFKPIVEARLDEALRVRCVDAHLSVIFLCGSVLEGVLVGAAQQDPEKFNNAKAADGSPKHFHDWSLNQLIKVACEIGILKPDVEAFGHGLRNFRNYIHPYKEMKSGFTPNKRTAGLCLQALDAALASLAGEH